jgi:Flp pilus assembly protein TadD
MKPVQIFDKHLVELAAFICTPDENVSLVIEYSPHQMHRVIDACLKNKKKRPHSASSSASSSTGSSSSSSHQQHQSTSSAIAFKRYFRCPAAVTVAHLKRLLRYKLELTGLFEVK